MFQDLRNRRDRDDLDLVPVPLFNQNIRLIGFRNDDFFDACLGRSFDLVGDSAHRQDVSTYRKRPGHRHALVDRNLLQGRDNGSSNGNRCAVPFHAFISPDKLDMDVVVCYVGSGHVFDHRGHVQYRFFCNGFEPTGCYNTPFAP